MGWQPGKIGIIGSGSWATALAKILMDRQEEVNWYFRFRETVRKFKQYKHNPTYLTTVTFDTERINFYTDIQGIVEASDTLLLVTPSPYIKGVLQKSKPGTLTDKFVLNAVKGIIPDDLMLITDYLMNEFGLSNDQIGVLGGPTHAEEVALNRLSYITIGAKNRERAEALASLFRQKNVITQVSSDIAGIEYASVLKNVYAIAAGVCQGLRMGDNFQSVLVSNAIAEMNTFVRIVTNKERDITDSVYLGDLLVTAYSRYSRNRTFGTLIGKGYSVKQAQLEMEMIAEGYYGTKCIHDVNKRHKIDLPIAEMVYDILYHKANPKQCIENLSKNLT